MLLLLMRKRLKISPYGIYLGVLFTLSLLPFAAPILLKASESTSVLALPAKAIYLLYSFFCHQFHHRSIHFFDYQMAWCTRDTGIWLGILAGAIAIRCFRVKGIRWYWLLPFLVPIALDGGIQTIATVFEVDPYGTSGEPLYISSNLVRYLTGSFLGLGLSLWISPMMYEIFAAERLEALHLRQKAVQIPKAFQKLLGRLNKQVLNVVLLMVALGLLYLGFVWVWDLTSLNYKPSDFVDSAVKTPATHFFQRRANGVCSTEEGDLFAVECFF